MSTQQAVETNNGQPAVTKKGGPRSPKGKATSARNATKHGLFSRDVVLQRGMFKENQAQFDALLNDLVESYQPEGPLEMFCVERMAAGMWRYRRVVRVESGYVHRNIEQACGEPKKIFETKDPKEDIISGLIDAENHLKRLKEIKADPSSAPLLSKSYWEYVGASVAIMFGLDNMEYMQSLGSYDEKKKFLTTKLGIEAPKILDMAIDGCQEKLTTFQQFLDEEMKKEEEKKKERVAEAFTGMILSEEREQLISRRLGSLKRDVLQAYEELVRLQTDRLSGVSAGVRSTWYRDITPQIVEESPVDASHQKIAQARMTDRKPASGPARRHALPTSGSPSPGADQNLSSGPSHK